jgi:hypothetical protein
LFNLNFNHSFNQTYIFPNQPQLKVLFIKIIFFQITTTTTTATALPRSIELLERQPKIDCEIIKESKGKKVKEKVKE